MPWASNSTPGQGRAVPPFQRPIGPSERPEAIDIFPSEEFPRGDYRELKMDGSRDGLEMGCWGVPSSNISLDFRSDFQDFSNIPPRAVLRASPGPLGSRPGGFLFVRPAWAVVRGWKSPRDLVAGTEVNRKASSREDGAEGSGVAKS